MSDEIKWEKWDPEWCDGAARIEVRLKTGEIVQGDLAIERHDVGIDFILEYEILTDAGPAISFDLVEKWRLIEDE